MHFISIRHGSCLIQATFKLTKLWGITMKKLIITMSIWCLNINVFCGALSIGSGGFRPIDGMDAKDIRLRDAISLDPNRSPNLPAEFIKSINLDPADGQTFQYAKVLAFSSSPKRLKIMIQAIDISNNDETLLVSEVLPQGLTAHRLYQLRTLTNHHIDVSRYQYVMILEFLDGASTQTKQDLLGFVGLQFKYNS